MDNIGRHLIKEITIEISGMKETNRVCKKCKNFYIYDPTQDEFYILLRKLYTKTGDMELCWDCDPKSHQIDNYLK